MTKMIKKHPLTDEICEQIADTKDRPFTSIEKDNMRAVYDHAIDCCVAWLDENCYKYTTDNYLGDMSNLFDLPEDLGKAMRSQKKKNGNK